MKRYTINNMNIYEADPVKEMRFIKKLVELDYIVTYDKQIIEQEEKILNNRTRRKNIAYA